MSKSDTSIQNLKESRMSKVGLLISKRSMNLKDELNNMHGTAAEKVAELVKSLRNDGLTDNDIKKWMLKEVKFISRSSIYSALPKEVKRKYKSSRSTQGHD